MTMMLLIAGGFVLLFLGGEALVRGSVGVARRFGVSELIIGLTLVGFGTSVPELVTSLRAIETDAVGIAVGNVVGSNIANILLVLGVAALIAPIITHPKALARDTSFMVAVTIVLVLLVYFDLFTRPVGILLVVLLLLYILASLLLDLGKKNPAAVMHAEEGETVTAEDTLIVSLLLAVGGVILVVLGARLLVSGAVQLATAMGVSETVVGLSIVAVGTSLPEVATSAVAALRGKSDVALGNVLGSNIFNILGILGVTAMVHPFSVFSEEPAARSIMTADTEAQGTVSLPIVGWEHIGALLLSVFLLLLFAFTERRIARWEGLVLLGAYVLYLGMLFEWVPTPMSAMG